MTCTASSPEARPRVRTPYMRDLAQRVRGLIRGSEASMVVLGVIAGVVAGLAVALLGTISSEMHSLLFGIGAERLSGVRHLTRGYAVPIFGGLVLAAVNYLWTRRRR